MHPGPRNRPYPIRDDPRLCRCLQTQCFTWGTDCSECHAELTGSKGLSLTLQVSPSVMERYPDQDIVQAIEAALQVMELAGAEIVRDFDLVGWDYCASKRVEMPDNIMLREGEPANRTSTSLPII